MADSFADRLREALDIRGLKAVDLHNKTGISKSRISQYLKGSYEAKEHSLKLIADALNVNVVWLMGYDVPIEPDRNKVTKYTESVDDLKNNVPFKTLAAHISEELGLSEEMAKKVIEIAKTLKDIK